MWAGKLTFNKLSLISFKAFCKYLVKTEASRKIQTYRSNAKSLCHSHIIETYFVIKWFEYYKDHISYAHRKGLLLKLDRIHYAKYHNIYVIRI